MSFIYIKKTFCYWKVFDPPGSALAIVVPKLDNNLLILNVCKRQGEILTFEKWQ